MRAFTLSALFMAAITTVLDAQQPGIDALLRQIDAGHARSSEIARRIWGLAEVGYQETKSSALLQEQLRAAGFRIEAGVAGIPTAFVASWGSGQPVIGILGEYDALPGLSQDSVPERKILLEGGSGHGCGHHLFGVASAAAAIAVKDWLQQHGKGGTIRFYGTPAEEGGGAKVYMVRAGLFRDVDAVVAWHPSDANRVMRSTTLANISAKFRFRGVSAHAAIAPHQGRSALDGVEAMNAMVNLLREHVPSEARIHYVITAGGRAPNVVPDYAESYYYARHSDMRVLEGIWERILATANGAALGTGTKVEVELMNSVYNVLPNQYLSDIAEQALQRVGGYRYSPEEGAFAASIRGTLTGAPADSDRIAAAILPADSGVSNGSTDVGDVSWVVPTVQVSTATWVPGTPAHTWQAVAAGGMSIGMKGMNVAAKAMALTAVELFGNPAHLTKARAEQDQRLGGYQYSSKVGDRDPPLDYRK
ncbi:MAG: amidohydrolase [Gemmatimonadales bacterium]|nr:amidohydrolase [Gemmatimonadales bacterium]